MNSFRLLLIGRELIMFYTSCYVWIVIDIDIDSIPDCSGPGSIEPCDCIAFVYCGGLGFNWAYARSDFKK
jgi:hypothetical protein